jgi:hypothetical protein
MIAESKKNLIVNCHTHVFTNQSVPNVLFGSDYYVVQREASERDCSIGLRGYLGEDKFDQIARENPKRSLGL